MRSRVHIVLAVLTVSISLCACGASRANKVDEAHEHKDLYKQEEIAVSSKQDAFGDNKDIIVNSNAYKFFEKSSFYEDGLHYIELTDDNGTSYYEATSSTDANIDIYIDSDNNVTIDVYFNTNSGKFLATEFNKDSKDDSDNNAEGYGHMAGVLDTEEESATAETED